MKLTAQGVIWLVTAAAVVFIVATTTWGVTPDRIEPIIRDSLVHCQLGVSCIESGRKQIMIYNKEGQIICSYWDVMTLADTQLYYHSKIENETKEAR